MGKDFEGEYHSGDPFFVVTCNACGAQYWSTRRINKKCAKCGKDNPVTEIPDYLHGNEKDKRQ